MKHVAFFWMALVVTGYKPNTASDPSPVEQGAPETLMSYTASEWEPSWSLKLIDGKRIEFRQLDPVGGTDMIADVYLVTRQTSRADGWTVVGESEKGGLTFTTKNMSAKGGCTHSASGLTHRDSVTVQSPLKQWRGCGGPEL